MVIKIDLSHLPQNLRVAILNEMETRPSKSKSQENGYNSNRSGNVDRNDDTIMILHNENDIKKIKQRIKDFLIRNRIREFVAIEDDKEENKIVILKKHHAEKLGIYHCTHCAMAFDSEILLGIHQRIHYII